MEQDALISDEEWDKVMRLTAVCDKFFIENDMSVTSAASAIFTIYMGLAEIDDMPIESMEVLFRMALMKHKKTYYT